MKEIPLNGKYGTGKTALVDDADYAVLSRHSWHVSKKGHVQRTTTTGSRTDGTRRDVRKFMHREVLGLTDTDPLCGDHINRNKLDNRRSNLRSITSAQNAQNYPPRRGGTSEYRGVSYVKRTGKWRASAQVDGKMNWLGCWHTEEEAAKVAAEWRRENMPYAED